MCHFSIRDKLSKLWGWHSFTLLVVCNVPLTLIALHFFLLLLCDASCIIFFPSFSYLKEFGFTIPDRPIMVDDIRVRGCGKSGIKSVYKAKMGHGQAKPVTVHGLYYTHIHRWTCHIHVNTQLHSTLNSLLFLSQTSILCFNRWQWKHFYTYLFSKSRKGQNKIQLSALKMDILWPFYLLFFSVDDQVLLWGRLPGHQCVSLGGAAMWSQHPGTSHHHWQKQAGIFPLLPLIQFNFIYIASNHNKSHLMTLYI